MPAWAQTQKDPTCTGPPPHDPKATVIEIRLERLCKIIALAVFGICVALDLSSTLFQVSPKKRFLSSLVLCANGISFVSYCAMLWDWFPQWKDMDGGSLEWLHIFQWGFTTPCAIVILSSLGAPMEDQNILNTQLTLKVCGDTRVCRLFPRACAPIALHTRNMRVHSAEALGDRGEGRGG
eukprot:2297402-Rhodomonas_salina.2